MNESAAWEDLCRRLKSSDSDAFEQIFRLIRDDLLRFVQSIVHGEAEAHDLVQDVFVALWDLRESLDPSLSLRAYLFRMARNRAYRHLRDERLHAQKRTEIQQSSSPEPPSLSPGETMDAELLEALMKRWIGDLPERQREALVLTRYHELSHQEVAAVMDISPRTVNNHVIRALDAIRSRLNTFESTVQENGPKEESDHQR